MVGFQVRRAASLWRATAGFVVVASVGGRCVEMAGSAAAIWAALPGPDAEAVSLQVLVAQLATAHEVSVDVAERDVVAVLESLEAIGCAVRLP